MTKESHKIYNIDSKIESPNRNRSSSHHSVSKSSHHHKSSKHKKKHSRSRSRSHDKKEKSRHRTKSPNRRSHHKKSSRKSSRSRSKSRVKEENKILDKNLLKSIKKDVEKLNEMKSNLNSNSIEYSRFHLSGNFKTEGTSKSNEINEFISKCKQISSSDKQNSYNNNSWKISNTINYEINTKTSSSNVKSSVSDDFNKLAITYHFDSNKQTANISDIENQVKSTVTKLFPVSSGTIHRKVEEIDKLDFNVFPKSPQNNDLTINNLEEIVKHDKTEAFKNFEELAISQPLLGKFTGQTDIKLLTPEELEGEYKAWAKKNMLINAAPITEGIGKKLLEKMGWKEGQGLGKHKEGPIEPLKLDVKIDRKGLVTQEEVSSKNKVQISINKESMPVSLIDDNKHPVSLLIELCRANRWPDPVFEVVDEKGPPHLRNFLMKCILNNNSYQPDNFSPNKKLAKANAAAVCLKAIGYIK